MSKAVPIDEALLKQFALPPLDEDGSKEDRGRLLVIAGSRGLAGAALLAGLAALRAGAGKLQIGTSESLSTALAVAVPEARVIGYPETEEGCIAEAGIRPLIGWAEGAQAVAIGCGLKQGPPLKKLVAGLLACDNHVPVILDAAILDCLEPLETLLQAWPGGAILLPHAGEMARLLDRDREAVEADPEAAALEASQRFRAVALIKGRYSYIAAPDGRSFRLEGGGIGLATSGSGDALAGIVGGLCARGADPLTATLWGAWLHAEAGRALGRRIGRVGFLAREIVDEIPALLPQD